MSETEAPVAETEEKLPDPTEEAPVEAPPEEGQEGSEETPAAAEGEEESYETTLERYRETEAWREADDARLEEARGEAFQKGHGEAQRRVQPIAEAARKQYTESNANWQRAANALEAINEARREAEERGDFSVRTVREAWDRQSEGLTALTTQSTQAAVDSMQGEITQAKSQASFSGEMGFITRVFGEGTKLAEEYGQKLTDIAQQSKSQDECDTKNGALVKEMVAKIRAPLQAENAQLKASLEGGKQGAREGQKPNMGQGSASNNSPRDVLDSATASIDEKAVAYRELHGLSAPWEQA